MNTSSPVLEGPTKKNSFGWIIYLAIIVLAIAGLVVYLLGGYSKFSKAVTALVAPVATTIPGIVTGDTVVTAASPVPQARMCMEKSEMAQMIKDSCEAKAPLVAQAPKKHTSQKIRAPRPQSQVAQVPAPLPVAPALTPKVAAVKPDFADRYYLEAGAEARLKSDPAKVIPKDTVLAETKHSTLLMAGSDCKTWATQKMAELLWKPKDFLLEEKNCVRTWNDSRKEKKDGLSVSECKAWQQATDNTTSSVAPAPALGITTGPNKNLI